MMSDQAAYLSPESLSKVPLFEGFETSELEQLRSTMEVETAKKGVDLIREQQICTPDFYILMEGEVEVYEGGVLMARREPYAIIGEIAFLVEHERTATVRAATDCTFIKVDQIQTRALLEDYPGVAWKLMETIAAHLARRFMELDQKVRGMLRECPEEIREQYRRARVEGPSGREEKG